MCGSMHGSANLSSEHRLDGLVHVTLCVSNPLIGKCFVFILVFSCSGLSLEFRVWARTVDSSSFIRAPFLSRFAKFP